ncbi:hypothetical protein [uncultured Albimonas sp.]|uniref:hypothetical protein n=1 Tax=uncultured Albimonas sp. TaxID=1331701 RepID=UPI0030EED57A|tara:strand:- start:6156 stop:6512 length:357 start_codon:yes stop_codon:yes gene_type:complete
MDDASEKTLLTMILSLADPDLAARVAGARRLSYEWTGHGAYSLFTLGAPIPAAMLTQAQASSGRVSFSLDDRPDRFGCVVFPDAGDVLLEVFAYHDDGLPEDWRARDLRPDLYAQGQA